MSVIQLDCSVELRMQGENLKGKELWWKDVVKRPKKQKGPMTLYTGASETSGASSMDLWEQVQTKETRTR